MKKIGLSVKNIYFFFEFLFALVFISKEKNNNVNTKNILITPLRGTDNTWIDYILAIKFSKIHNITILMMRPSTLPFNEAEKYSLFSTQLMMIWYEIRFFLVKKLLQLRDINTIIIEEKNINNIEKINSDINILIETAKDEFLRRYFGFRNYKDYPLYSEIKLKVDNVFYNIYKTIDLEIKNIDLLWTSHAIYEWKIPYSLALKYNKKVSVWGRNIYNADLISVSNGPLQVSIPSGYLHKEYKIDFEKRIGGVEMDQPVIFDNHFDETINKFFLVNKNIVLLTPNCIWDGDISDRDSIFDSLYEWVKFTLDLAKEYKKLAVIVRFHPAEATLWKKRPGLWKMFENIELTDNQLLIPPFSKISTIELAKKSNKVVFYSGILALECLHLNIKPFCVSNSFYKYVKGVYEIKSKNEYINLLKNDTTFGLESSGTVSHDDLFCYGLKIFGKNTGLRSNPRFRFYGKQVEIYKYFIDLLDDKK